MLCLDDKYEGMQLLLYSSSISYICYLPHPSFSPQSDEDKNDQVCPRVSANREQCHNGQVCPERSTEPRDCGLNFYCPGAREEIPCPLGKICNGTEVGVFFTASKHIYIFWWYGVMKYFPMV